jgi:hypothetical protein
MLREKFRHDRQQEMPAERHIRMHAQASARYRAGGGAALGLVEIGEHAHPAFVEHATFRRELQATGRAVHEARAKPRLEA